MAACKYYEVECLSDELSAWGGGTGVTGRVLVPSVLTAVSFLGLDAAESDAAGAARGSKVAAGSLAASFILTAIPGGQGARGLVRTEARNLAEKLVMEEAAGGAGREIMQGKIKDAARSGWAKMQHTHTNPDGSVINVHYWKNRETGVIEDLKFKNP